MLKFVKHHMESIFGIEMFPLISMIIFLLFFIAVGVMVWREKKAHVDHMSQLPLDPDPETN